MIEQCFLWDRLEILHENSQFQDTWVLSKIVGKPPTWRGKPLKFHSIQMITILNPIFAFMFLPCKCLENYYTHRDPCMVYLPTFTIKINHSCRWVNIPVPWILWDSGPWWKPGSSPFHVNNNPPPTTTFENTEVLEQPSRNVPWQRPRPVPWRPTICKEWGAVVNVEVMVGWNPHQTRFGHPKHLLRRYLKDYVFQRCKGVTCCVTEILDHLSTDPGSSW